jgi:hypothetical protein
MTLSQAALLYWESKGKHLRTAPAVERKIELLLRLLGEHKRVTEISTADIDAAMQKRRNEFAENKARGARRASRPKKVAPSTVNRDLIGQLRPILNHAAEMHNVTLQRINWKRLKIPETQPRVREEFTDEEVDAWSAELGRYERMFLIIAMTYGARFGEMFFPPDAVKAPFTDKPVLEIGRYIGRSGVVRTSRKDGSLHRSPLTIEHGHALGVLAQRAAAAKLPVIWFDEMPDGKLLPITYWGMNARLIKAAARAGIEKGRIIHGMRHHAATNIARRTRSVLLAQKALGHKQASTTQRYAHVTEDDLRAGFTEVSRHSPAALEHKPS